MKTQLRVIALFAVATWLGLGACNDDTTPGPSGPPSVSTDREIAAIVKTANEGEIQVGQYAKDRATNGDVKDFAEDMVSEHRAALDRQNALFSNNGISPSENATSQELRRDAEMTLAMLQTLIDNAFDKAYMDSQVKMHSKVLSLLDSQLLPKVVNQELRGDLMRMRQDVAMHLGHAQVLQGQLPAATGGNGCAQTACTESR